MAACISVQLSELILFCGANCLQWYRSYHPIFMSAEHMVRHLKVSTCYTTTVEYSRHSFNV